jgi:Na+/melibiose symporter-like transporter
MIAEIGESIQGILGVMIPIVAIVGGLSLGFAGFYLRYRERMEMIARGIDVSKLDYPKRPKNRLRSAFIVLGVGVGLLLAYVLCNTVLANSHPDEDQQTVIYFGVVITCVGLGMVLSHVLEKKETPQVPDVPNVNRPQ